MLLLKRVSRCKKNHSTRNALFASKIGVTQIVVSAKKRSMEEFKEHGQNFVWQHGLISVHPFVIHL